LIIVPVHALPVSAVVHVPIVAAEGIYMTAVIGVEINVFAPNVGGVNELNVMVLKLIFAKNALEPMVAILDGIIIDAKFIHL
jgi:ABC-type siderophore export system fused ATPase/permease subunit